MVRTLLESRYDRGTHLAWGQEELALGVDEPSVGEETRKAEGFLRFGKGATRSRQVLQKDFSGLTGTPCTKGQRM